MIRIISDLVFERLHLEKKATSVYSDHIHTSLKFSFLTSEMQQKKQHPISAVKDGDFFCLSVFRQSLKIIA